MFCSRFNPWQHPPPSSCQIKSCHMRTTYRSYSRSVSGRGFFFRRSLLAPHLHPKRPHICTSVLLRAGDFISRRSLFQLHLPPKRPHICTSHPDSLVFAVPPHNRHNQHLYSVAHLLRPLRNYSFFLLPLELSPIPIIRPPYSPQTWRQLAQHPPPATQHCPPFLTGL